MRRTASPRGTPLPVRRHPLVKHETARFPLDHPQQQKDQDDEEDEAEGASTVVAEPRTQTVAPESEQQDKNDEKNNHECLQND